MELRIALTVPDVEEALRLYRDALGLTEVERFDGPDGHGVVLAADSATLELLDQRMAATVDRMEAGARVSGPVRLALQVAAVEPAREAAVAAGARPVAEVVTTPWGHRNARLSDPAGNQLTLFEVPEPA